MATSDDWFALFRAALTGSAIIDASAGDPNVAVDVVVRASRIADLATDVVREKEEAARERARASPPMKFTREGTLPSLSPTRFEDVSSSSANDDDPEGKGRDS